MDLSQLSDDDLLAIESGDFRKLSDAGLSFLEQQVPEGLPTTMQGGVVTPDFGDYASEAGRQVGLTARGAVTGAASPATMLGDPLNQLINMITGSNIPSASESLQNLMNMAGVPQPRTPTERVSQDVVAGMSGVGAVPAIARGASKLAPQAMDMISPLLQRLGLQTTAAGAAGAGAGSVREGGGGQGAQIAAGLGAGLFAPASMGVAGTTARGARALAQPFTQGGQQQMAGRLLANQATDPMEAIRRMQSTQPSITGSQPTMAGASQDYGLASLERTLSQVPEASGNYAQRLAKNNEARNLLMNKFTANKVLENAIEKREQIAIPILNRTFQAKTPVKINPAIEKIDQILSSPSGASKIVQEELNDYKTRLQKQINQNGFADPENLYVIRKEIAATLDGLTVGSKAENLKKLASKELIQVRDALDNVIASGAPEYPEYMRLYRTMSKPVDQIKAMRDLSDTASGGTVNPVTGFRNYTPVRFGKLVEKIAQDKNSPLTKTQLGVLKNVAKELDEGAMINLPGIKPAGSDTFKNLTVANLLGNISANPSGLVSQVVTNLARPISWLYSGGEDAVRQLLVDAMLDPKLAAQLMKKATAQNLNQTGMSLAQKAAQMGYGATFGLNASQ